VNWRNKSESLVDMNLGQYPDQNAAFGLATHRIQNCEYDSVIHLCNELDFKNPERRIHPIYCDAYLNGNDGVIDIVYEQVLAAVDLTVFPSFYEPWDIHH